MLFLTQGKLIFAEIFKDQGTKQTFGKVTRQELVNYITFYQTKYTSLDLTTANEMATAAHNAAHDEKAWKRCKEGGCKNGARGASDYCHRHGGGVKKASGEVKKGKKRKKEKTMEAVKVVVAQHPPNAIDDISGHS